MKNFRFLALVSAVFLIITACEDNLDECVQRCHDNNANYSKSDCETQCSSQQNNNDGNSSECSYGQHKCIESSTYYCSNGYWTDDEYCTYGCNTSTGKCYSGSNGGGSSSECSYGQHKCSGSSTYYCSNGYWEYDEYCTYGCNTSTGKCNDERDTEPTVECTPGEYACDDNNVSYFCTSWGTWSENVDCKNDYRYDKCNYLTGKCNCTVGLYRCFNQYSSWKCNDGQEYELYEVCSDSECDDALGICE